MTRRRLAAGQAARLRRRPARLPVGRRRGRRARRPRSRPACGPRSRRSTPARAEFEADDAVPLLDLRGRGRGRARATGRKVVILGSRPQPHRPGHRVRLLLRPRQLRPARRRLRDDHGQLQPRDGVDRLRHQRPPLLRAAHLRGRAATSSRPSRQRRARGVDRGARRPDAAEAGRPAAAASSCSAPAPDVDRPGRGPRALERAVRPARDPPAGRRHGHRRSTRRSAIADRIGYPVLVRPELRARRPGHGDRLRRREPAPGHGRAGRLRQPRPARAACRPSGRCSSTASSRTPPRSTSTPSATPPARSLIGGVMEHVEEAGVHSGDSRLRHPAATRCPPTTIARHRGLHPAHRRRARRARPDQRAVRGEGATRSS